MAVNEPIIVINGVLLPLPAAMTVRVAIESFAIGLQSGLGDDEHGEYMTSMYKQQIDFIHACMSKE